MAFKIDLRTPTACFDCHFSDIKSPEHCYCHALHFTIRTSEYVRPDVCPIIEIPETEQYKNKQLPSVCPSAEGTKGRS